MKRRCQISDPTSLKPFSQVCDWSETAGCQAVPREVSGCKEGVLSGDPASCSGYFMCVHSKLQPFSCQGVTHWDDSLKVWNMPSPSYVSSLGVQPP